MRHLLVIISVFLLSSCASYYSEYVGFVDYSIYNESGMFLSESNSVSFDYDPIGSIQVFIQSGYERDFLLN